MTRPARPRPAALRSLARLASMLGVVLAGGASCDRGDQQALSPGRMGPALQIVATSPSDGQTGVALDAAIRIRFDRFLDPTTAIRQSIRVTGGTIRPDGSSVDGEAFFTPTYDVLERVVVFRLAGGGRWQPGLLYRVDVWSPAARTDGNGFRAWDGATAPRTLSFSFRTTTDIQAPATEAPPPTASYCARCDGTTLRPGVGATLLASCGSTSCHGPVASAAMNLALDSHEGVRATALGQVAHETLGGLTTGAETNPALFGVSMPIIDPGQPANSYLTYKLLLDDRLWDRPGSDDRFGPQPVGGAIRPDAAEIGRMRDIFLAGEPMPPPTHEPLDLGRAQELLTWIGAGAPPPPGGQCPPVDCTSSGSSGQTGAAP